MSSNKPTDQESKDRNLGAITAGALLGAGALLLASRADREKMKSMTQSMIEKIKASFKENMDKAEQSVQSLQKNGRQLAADIK